jgi:predicted phosphodiesterase
MTSKKLLRVLFIPDTHVPYHDKRAWKLLLKFARKWKPDVIVFLGDFADCYYVSKFPKDPKRKGSFDDEVAAVNVELSEVEAIGAKRVVFIEGNHCHRVAVYIQQNAKALDAFVSIEKAFKLKERGWIHVKYRDHYRLGRVYLTHDVNATGRNAAHRVLDTYQHSAITGHTHRMIYVVEADGLGTPILSAQFGWLGDITKVDYAHKITATKSYVLGFGMGYLEEQTGLLFASPVPIVDYRCMVEGQIYEG